MVSVSKGEQKGRKQTPSSESKHCFSKDGPPLMSPNDLFQILDFFLTRFIQVLRPSLTVNPGWFGTLYVDKGGLKLTKIHQPLSPEFWY